MKTSDDITAQNVDADKAREGYKIGYAGVVAPRADTVIQYNGLDGRFVPLQITRIINLLSDPSILPQEVEEPDVIPFDMEEKINIIFFELIRVAIGNQVCLSHTPSADEWGELYAIAKKQSLVGICFAGVQKLQKQRQCPPKSLYLKWMGSAAVLMRNYETMQSMKQRLHGVFVQNGIGCLLLKGLALSEYYNEPGMRAFGDMDIYSPDSCVKVDELLKPISKGFSVEYYRHSECKLDGVTIENHRFLTDVRGQKRWHDLESYLHSLAVSRIGSSKGLSYPDETFTILFFVYHALGHFLYEKLTLKFMVDWCMLLQKRGTLPEKLLDERLNGFGLMRFAAYMSRVCVLRLSMDESLLTAGLKSEMSKIEDKQLQRFVDDIFRDDYTGFTSNSLKDRIERGFDFLCKAWKLREFLGVSPARFVFDKFVGLFEKPYANRNNVN